MIPKNYATLAKQLCLTCQLFGERGWCRATSGNFSVRISDSHCMITQSGREKSVLSANDLMICTLDGVAVNPQDRPSAETPLHTCLYRLDANIGAVLHTHSVTATVLSRRVENELSICGFEMQKAMAGISSHEQRVAIVVFDNSQDMNSLADTVRMAWHAGQLSVGGFLIRGHGLYAWGRDLDEARRHTEGLEFLFECLWQEGLAESL
jgi:methylthioribulose-1-phosphate dehydratase